MNDELKNTEEFKVPGVLVSPVEDGFTVNKDYVPEGFETREAFLADMRKNYDLDLEYDRDNREQANDDKRFAAGEQWDRRVLELREGLPCLVINSIPQFTAQLVGDWRESRKAIKVVPSEDGDEEIASVRGDLIRAIEMKSRANRVYDTVFESAVQCGDGAFRVSVEYAKDDVFDQDIFIRPIDDALSVVWDRFSVDNTGRDARRCWVDDMIPTNEFEMHWPDAKVSELPKEMRNEMTNYGWVRPEGVRVSEYWRMIERKRFLGLFADGSIRFIDNNLDELIDNHGEVQRTRLSPCSYAQAHIVTGFEILAGPYEYRLTRLPIIRMMGRVVNVEGRKVRYGLVRFMKDPVRLRNFWRSVAAEQLGYAPKAQWLATESALEGREEDFRKAHLSRDPVLFANDEAEFGKNLIRLDPPPVQAALLNEANVNTQDMKDVTGIHDASLGIRSNETSGRAISARQREGDIASLTYYDNGNGSVLEAGDVINQLINQIYDGTRIVRVIGEDQKVKFLKVNDPYDPNSPDLSTGSYDVALTTGVSYTTRRVEAAQAMMEAVQVWPQMLEVAGDLVAKAQDWPGAEELAERLKKTIPQQFLDEEDKAEQPDPALQEAQLQMQAMAQELQQLQLDKSLELEKLKIAAFEAQTKRLAVVSDEQFKYDQLAAQTVADAQKEQLSEPDSDD